MDIEHRKSESGGAFVVEERGEQLAEMTYSRVGNRIVIDHTKVSSKLEGRGVGRKLVTEAVKWARADKLEIEPVCSFARALFDRTPDFSDVRAK